MKTVVLISATLVLLISIAAFGEENYVAKPNEEMYTTWTNPSMHPPKTVDFLGGYRDYLDESDTTPTGGEGTEQIMSKWTDSAGDIWYKTFGTVTVGTYAGVKFQTLTKVSKNGKVREVITVAPVSSYDSERFPQTLDPSNSSYRIYYRAGD